MSTSSSRRAKFGIVDGTISDVVDDGFRPYRYADTFARETLRGGVERIVVGPAGNAIALLVDLAGCLPEPLRVLYVLMVPRVEDIPSGRYEAPRALSRP